MTTMTIWYIARGAGLAALVLLTVATGLGALMTGRGRSSTRIVWNYMHRVTTGVGLTALALHLGAILADSYAHVGWVASLVPFTSAFRPNWVGLGTVAVYIFLLVGALGFARGRIAASAAGARAWRWLHGLGYLGWGMAMVHGLQSGTDSGQSWVKLLYVACGAAVAVAVTARVARERLPDLVRYPVQAQVTR
ncbi:MAG TPA: hypothetical protein VIG48_03125 [Jatrophihabitans sp.]|jgi:DMSO/TMAO reductase YedYZ heme-binding membrane subunit